MSLVFTVFTMLVIELTVRFCIVWSCWIVWCNWFFVFTSSSDSIIFIAAESARFKCLHDDIFLLNFLLKVLNDSCLVADNCFMMKLFSLHLILACCAASQSFATRFTSKTDFVTEEVCKLWTTFKICRLSESTKWDSCVSTRLSLFFFVAEMRVILNDADYLFCWEFKVSKADEFNKMSFLRFRKVWLSMLYNIRVNNFVFLLCISTLCFKWFSLSSSLMRQYNSL